VSEDGDAWWLNNVRVAWCDGGAKMRMKGVAERPYRSFKRWARRLDYCANPSMLERSLPRNETSEDNARGNEQKR
jgi:hypothetical protein